MDLKELQERLHELNQLHREHAPNEKSHALDLQNILDAYKLAVVFNTLPGGFYCIVEHEE